jgi:hypothetical protein
MPNKEKSSMKISEVFGDVISFQEKSNGELFQVASQFNLLEMITPEHKPEMGITIYENDPTQGPACAISAAAGTLFRNYFSNVNTLKNIEALLSKKYWDMTNGYTIFNEQSKELTDEVLKKEIL